MNILILTPIHPVQIIEMNALYKRFSNYNNIYSVQAMALLAETLKKEYWVANHIFTLELVKKPSLIFSKNKQYKHNIIYGNLDKKTNIKFDHIIAYSSHISENENNEFDPYLSKINKILTTDNNEIKIPSFYKEEDAEFTFSTFEHLFLFLKTLGIKENDN